MIALADSPLAIKHQARLVKQIPYAWVRYNIDGLGKFNAIDGLANIGTLEAVEELISIYEDISIDKENRDRALFAIEKLRRKGAPGILQNDSPSSRIREDGLSSEI